MSSADQPMTNRIGRIASRALALPKSTRGAPHARFNHSVAELARHALPTPWLFFVSTLLSARPSLRFSSPTCYLPLFRESSADSQQCRSGTDRFPEGATRWRISPSSAAKL